MIDFKLSGCIALFFAMFCHPVIGYSSSCEVDCPTGFKKSKSWNGCDCHCFCLAPNQFKKQEEMLAKFIQDREGIDKSKIVNLDEVIQKAVKESSHKVDTPVKFIVKIQEKENAPPKEVEYQIETSR